jgi:hypothetical protein
LLASYRSEARERSFKRDPGDELALIRHTALQNYTSPYPEEALRMLSPLLYGSVKGVREACYANEVAPLPFVGSIRKLLPDNLNLTTSVWYEVNYQIANHIRGKGWKIPIIWGISYLVFKLMGFQFTLFLILRDFVHIFMP